MNSAEKGNQLMSTIMGWMERNGIPFDNHKDYEENELFIDALYTRGMPDEVVCIYFHEESGDFDVLLDDEEYTTISDDSSVSVYSNDCKDGVDYCNMAINITNEEGTYQYTLMGRKDKGIIQVRQTKVLNYSDDNSYTKALDC